MGNTGHISSVYSKDCRGNEIFVYGRRALYDDEQEYIVLIIFSIIITIGGMLMVSSTTGVIEYKSHKLEIVRTQMGTGLFSRMVGATFLVLYDGKEVSRKSIQFALRSLIHDFKINEDGEEVNYTIIQDWKTKYAVSLIAKRNGQIIYERK
jgi:hypothetical protein